MAFIQNPILPGFHPDPSICRVGEDFYLVTSSFSFFPGLPVFHSRDLRHWEQIGHVVDRPGMVKLNGHHTSGGLWAPTIRWHEGLFYVICTDSESHRDFVCTAENPAGPWSDPHWIEGAPGIDPSLFWDDQGACYMTGNDWSDAPCHIWGCRFDEKRFCLVGQPVELWRGALVNAHAPEAPHLYQKDGYYYLLIAEGGTQFFHAITIARSASPLGPYVGYAGNPILTHRHLGPDAEITCTGHGDLVQLADGSWMMALLGCRPYGDRHAILGRETFLVPVDWRGDWPVVNPGVGRVETQVPAPEMPEHVFQTDDSDDWHSMAWNQLGCGEVSPVHIQGRDLLMDCVAPPIIPKQLEEDPAPLAFYGRRQQHKRCACQVKAVLPNQDGASCGLMALQNNFHSLRVEMIQKDGSIFVRCVRGWWDPKSEEKREEIQAQCEIASRQAELSLKMELQNYTFAVDGRQLITADGSFLGSDIAGGFIGAYLGVFASGNGKETGARAIFRDFQYRAE